jgi:tape measure domain-containing protein
MALEFRIDLSGNLSEKLGRSGEALKSTGEHAKHAKHEFEGFELETDKLAGGLGGLEFHLSALGKGGSLFTFDLAEGLHAAYEIVEGLVDKFIDLGKEMAGVAGKTQDLDLAVNLNVGDEKQKEVNELAESFERTTRFSAADMKRALLPLLKEGVGDKDTLDTVATIATDLAARNGGGIADVQQSISAFAGIFQRGRLKPAQLAQFGIQANDYFEVLGHTLGVSGEAAAKLAKKGKVAQDQLADVAINMIAKRQGGAIGGPSLKADETMGATLERLSKVKDHLFEGVADSQGMKDLQGFLDNFIKTMKGPIGTDLVNQLSTAFSTLFGDLSGPDGLKKVEAGVGAAAKKVQELIAGFQAAWPSIKSGLEALPGILNEIVRLGEEFAIIWTANKLVNGVAAFAAILSSQGIVGGLAAMRTGLNAALSPVAALTIAFEAWRYAFDKISETIKELGGLKHVAQDFKDWLGGNNASGIAYENHVTDSSPEWKKNRVAQKQAAGSLEVPLMADGGIVTRPTLLIAGDAGPEAIVPLSDLSMSSPMPLSRGLGGGGGPSITIPEITVQVVLADGSNGSDAGYAAAQSFRVELKKVLDEFGWAFGATTLE